MLKCLAILLGILALAQPSVADDLTAVRGTWKLVAYDLEFQDDGQRRPVLGKSPRGYIIFTPEGRMMAYLEAETRKPPRTDEERAAAYRTMVAYTGKYRFEGDKWVTRVDASWNVDWVGTEQERFYKLDGQQLHVISQWVRAPSYDNRMVRGILIWERER
jgi:hypothetical protein